MKKRLVAFLIALVMVMTFAVSAMAATGDKIVFEGPNNSHDVTLNGQPITIYCLQQRYVWPETGYDGNYTEYYEADEEHHLLTSEQTEILRRLMFAGYPHNDEGIFDEEADEVAEMFGMTPEEFAAEVTQQAVWALMRHWGQPGNYEGDILDVLNDTFGPMAPFIEELIDFALNGGDVNPPSSSKVTISGSGMLNYTTDGQWKSGALQITEPQNYQLTYEFTLPQGVKAVDDNGNELTAIHESQKFYLVADSLDNVDMDNAVITVKDDITYPTKVTHYMTDAYQTNSATGLIHNYYQTMLSVGVGGMTLTGSLDISAETVDMEITKVWNDQTDPSGRPESVALTVMRNGSQFKNDVTVSAGDRWQVILTGLPEGNYEVVESDVEGYKSSVSVTPITGMVKVTVTNTLEGEPDDPNDNPGEDPDKPGEDPDKPGEDPGEDPDKPGDQPNGGSDADQQAAMSLPNTGDEANLALYAVMLLAAAFMLTRKRAHS